MPSSRYGNLIAWATTLIVLCSLAAGPADAQGATVAQSGTAVTADCVGGDATLNGSGDSIIFRNACRTLTVNGSGNTIQIELTSAGTITLNGTGNRVSYTPIGGSASATVTDHGQGNSVVQMGALARGTTTIIGSTAAPGSVSVHGANGESLQIGPSGIIAVPAPGTGGMATVTPGTTVVAPSGAVATQPGQLVLSGDSQNRDMSCGGAAVYISGDRGRFTLRGGCKAIYIRGDHDQVHAELMPGAEIAIQGDNAMVYVVLTGAGPSPRLLVMGENSRAFLVQHIDDTTGTEIPASVRSGALPAPAGPAVAAIAGVPSVALLTPEAALAFARSQSLVALQRDLGAEQTARGMAISLSGDVLFDFDRDQLRPDAQRGLAELAVLIARTQPHGLRIVGYTDSIGSPQYNRDLSGRRARKLERWLLDYGRVQDAALDVEGRGAADPVAPNELPDGRDNPTGRQENRRIEVLLQQQQ